MGRQESEVDLGISPCGSSEISVEPRQSGQDSQISTECIVGIRAAHPQPLHVWGELRRTRRVTRVTEFHKHCKHTLWLLYCHIYYTKLKDAESLRKQLS
jgi:hypothetical protein